MNRTCRNCTRARRRPGRHRRHGCQDIVIGSVAIVCDCGCCDYAPGVDLR